VFALQDWLDRSAVRSMKQFATEQSCLGFFFFTFKLLHADFRTINSSIRERSTASVFQEVRLPVTLLHARVIKG